MRRPLDQARRERAGGNSVDQKRQHHARVALRLALMAVIDLERGHRDPFRRGHDEVRKIVIGKPIFTSGSGKKAWSRPKRTKIAMPGSGQDDSNCTLNPADCWQTMKPRKLIGEW